MSKNHKKETKKHAALQPLQGSHQGGSCIQPPVVKENSLDTEAQPWEAQAAAPLPYCFHCRSRKKIHRKDL